MLKKFMHINREYLKIKITSNSTEQSNGCWLWNCSKQSGGYGQVRVYGKRRTAHRLSYYAFNGFLHEDKLVCHKCDNPACVNPDHLWLGTHKENTLDAIQKGRMRPCVPIEAARKPRKRKLTDEQVLDIYNSKEPVAVVAARHGVSMPCISLIRSGRRKGMVSKGSS